MLSGMIGLYGLKTRFLQALAAKAVARDLCGFLG